MIYVVFPNKIEAKKAVATLLKEKLIVCGNIIPSVESVYTWKGKLESSKECIALLKTSLKHAKQVQKKLLKIHSYETPFMARIDLEDVNSGYARFMMENLVVLR